RDDRARLEDQRGPADVETESGEERPDPHREQHPQGQPQRRPDDPDDEGLDQDRAGDLPSAGTDGPQERELTPALGDEDAEGVDDEEGPDEQRDAGEDEQEGGDEPQ